MRVSRVVLVGGLTSLLLLAVGVVVQFATEWTGGGSWLAAPLTGMAAAGVELVKEALTRHPDPEDAPEETGPRARPTAPTPGIGSRTGVRTGRGHTSRRGRSVTAAVAVTLLVLGGGGVAVTYAVSRVSGYVTGNQAGVDRLVGGPVQVDAGGVAVEVSSLEQTANFTRVSVSVRNDLPNTVTLPLFGFVTLSAEVGQTLQADSFRSSWADTIAPGQRQTGTIVFDGHLPENATSATLVFAQVFEQGFDGPSSVAVPGVTLAPTG